MGARVACCWCSMWADLLVSGVGSSALSQVFICSGRILVGGTHACWRGVDVS